MRVKKETAYIIADDDAEIRLLRGSIEYLDSAMEITANGMSDYEQRHQYNEFFEEKFSKAVLMADLLVVRQVFDASDEDLRYLRGIIYKRARAGMPTAVD